MISEVDGGDDSGYANPAAGLETDGGIEEKPYSWSQVPPTHQHVNALTHSTTWPRRSASLCDASTPERPTAPPLTSAAASQSGAARPGTSIGLTNSRTGATRVTLEEKRRRDRETALEDAEYARAQMREEKDLDVDRRLFPQDHIVAVPDARCNCSTPSRHPWPPMP